MDEHTTENDESRAKVLEARRARAIAMHEEGLSGAEIGRRVGVSREAVRQWIASYRDKGVAGLAPRPRAGSAPRLDRASLLALGELLALGAKAYGFPTDTWTTPRIAELVLQRYDVRYHPDHIGRLLHRNGVEWQRPRARVTTEIPTAPESATHAHEEPRPAFLLWGLLPPKPPTRGRAA